MSTARKPSYSDLLQKVQPRPIRTTKDYRQQLAWIERIMDLPSTKDTSMMIEMLAMTIEAYESANFPIADAPSHRVLDHLIESSGKTLAEIARDLGVARSTISNYRTGRRKMTKDRIRDFSQYFGVSPDVFFGGDRVLRASGVGDIDQRVLEAVSKLGGSALTPGQVARHAKIPVEKVRKSLRRMADEGKLSVSGRGRAVRYSLLAGSAGSSVSSLSA